MPAFMRCTCSHCGHESFHDGSAHGLGAKIVKLTTAPCSECGAIGALITLNVNPPQRLVSWATRSSQKGMRAHK